MFLTRIRLNTARAGARKFLISPRAMHGAVTKAFAEGLPAPEAGARVLWRLDRNSRDEVYCYIVSPERPDLTHVVEQAGWPTTQTWETRDYAPFLARLEAGQRWAFRLTANPVHSIRRKDGEPTKVTAHRTPRHQLGWLLQRQEANGFQITAKPEERRRAPGDDYEVIVRDRHAHRFGKTESDGRPNQVALTSVTFDGRLEITDPGALRRMLTAGLGRAKAYGCGLMTLAPVD
ncbi:type I-E CRISPR-associated protein Cas6/Cse3/CasE [Nocardiopsis composta]|uniref:CRISPR system Cascade subunit CasE n=1 Tax=Nocardiopsis composta TaxID=157465 RepID=A0A7W8QJR5_9ACTN|nr:type I-E CRISPR-associated protein Cas6/Cse3/CasE [Nocardiopsis composta]MBB5431040.1 CRISPR system Cascade subunit CasE [Nocardiopsis composta]